MPRNVVIRALMTHLQPGLLHLPCTVRRRIRYCAGVRVLVLVVALSSLGCGPVSPRSTACVAYGEWVQCHYAGFEFIGRGNMSKARDMYRRACGRGFSGACISLALMYQDGVGGEKDVGKARELLDKHCDPVKTACMPQVDPLIDVHAIWSEEFIPVTGK